MSSHVRRLQYHQQRQAQLGRNGSASALRQADLSSYAFSDEGSILRSGVEGSVISGRTDPSFQTGSRDIPPPMTRSAYLDARRSPSLLSGGGIRYDQSEARGPGSMLSQQASTVAGRSLLSRPSLYARSNLQRSRSLAASKASLATVKSGRSTIQMEHHDRKVQLLINAVDFKKAKKPYFWSITFFTLFLLTLFLGLLIICLRHVYMNLVLSPYLGEAIGPLICGASFLFLGAGFKFLYDAYQLGAKERQKIKYQSASASTVAVKLAEAPAVEATEELVSGKTTDKALSRAPIGTRTVAPSVLSY
nr:unnamed protein product [Spirometra erinaceieuropaei]